MFRRADAAQKAADITNGFLKFISRKRVGANSQRLRLLKGKWRILFSPAMLGEILSIPSGASRPYSFSKFCGIGLRAESP
jgi:hypothetical protein